MSFSVYRLYSLFVTLLLLSVGLLVGRLDEAYRQLELGFFLLKKYIEGHFISIKREREI